MKYEFHPLEPTTKVNLKSAENKKNINFLISYKYIEYQKLFHHPYRILEYELLKLKFHSTSNQKLKNHLTF
jgi:hypothetical protein